MREDLNLISSDKRLPLKFSIVRFDVISPHMHYQPELLLILDGKCKVNSENKDYLFEKEDMILFNKGVYHSISSTENALIISMKMDLKELGLSDIEVSTIHFNLNTVAKPNDPCYESIRYFIYSIIKHNSIEKSNSVYTNKALIYSLFALLMNNFAEFKETSNNEYEDLDTINKVICYLESHYKENISLSFLAEKFNYTTSYLSRLFKSSLGKNYLEYYDSLRLNYCVHDLIFTNNTIDRIASENGFENSRSFVRAFRKVFNCYPSEYRKANPGKINTATMPYSKLEEIAIEKINEAYSETKFVNGNQDSVKK